jgi:hypothetical protein
MTTWHYRVLRYTDGTLALHQDVAPGDRADQEEFAGSYHIPLGTLSDWEQGRTEPDQPARAYLKAIAGDPVAVQRALEVSHP